MKNIIQSYAHDYRDMSLSQIELEKILEKFTNEIIGKVCIEILELEEEMALNSADWFKGHFGEDLAIKLKNLI